LTTFNLFCFMPTVDQEFQVSTGFWTGRGSGLAAKIRVAMSEFTHLHLHTVYSLLDGACEGIDFIEIAEGASQAAW